MITMRINQAEREWPTLDDVQESWITQQINERHRASQQVCVSVRITTPGVDVSMIAGQCQPSYGGGGRMPNQDERRILDLWANRAGRNGHVDPGDVISFLKQLQRLI
jgi:hypothetical protein